jgi:DNA-directed RNA polymerase subunit beta
MPVLAIDHINVGAVYPQHDDDRQDANREEALIDIYRVMRPGEPPTVESADPRCSSRCSSIRAL